MATSTSSLLTHRAHISRARLWNGPVTGGESSQPAYWSSQNDAAHREEVPGDCTAHPGSGCTSSELVAHALQVHHRALRSQLLWSAALLDKIAPRTPVDQELWRSVHVTFADLRRKLLDCLSRERYSIFPAMDEASDAQLRESTSLHAAVRAVEKLHCRSLRRLWKLGDLITRAAPSADDAEASAALVAELAALRDEYYQHLFEMECLLFPRVAPRLARGQSSPSAASKPERSALQRTTRCGHD